MNVALKVFYTGPQGAPRRFVEDVESSGLAAHVRGEQGCLRYEYYEACDGSGTVILTELWESRELLEAHQAATGEQFRAACTRHGVTPRIENYIPADF